MDLSNRNNLKLKDIILDNPINSWTFNKSKVLNHFFSGDIIYKNQVSGSENYLFQSATAMLNNMSVNNIQRVCSVGGLKYEEKEWNTGGIDETEAVPRSKKYNLFSFHNHYVTDWLDYYELEKDLVSVMNPAAVLREALAEGWRDGFNHLIVSILKGLSRMPELTVGDGAKGLKDGLIPELLTKRGDRYVNKLGKLFVNTTTFKRLLEEDDDENKLVVKRNVKENLNNNQDGTALNMDSEWYFQGHVPIIVNDLLEDNKLCFIDKGAFVYAEKTNLPNVIMYHNNPLKHGGTGEAAVGSKKLFMLHPRGFSFKVDARTLQGFSSQYNITRAEYANGGMFELIENDVSNSPILFVKIPAAQRQAQRGGGRRQAPREGG